MVLGFYFIIPVPPDVLVTNECLVILTGCRFTFVLVIPAGSKRSMREERIDSRGLRWNPLLPPR